MSYAQLEWHGQCIVTTKAHSAHRRHTRCQWCPREVLRSAGMTWAMYIDNEGTLGTPQTHAMTVVSKRSPTLSWNDMGNVYWQRRHTADTRDDSGVQEMSYAQLEWHGQCILTTKAHSAHRRHTRCQWCPREVLRSAGMTWAMYSDNEDTLGTPQTHAMTVVSKRCPTLSWNDTGNVYWQRRHTRHTADTRDDSGVQEMSYAQLEWHGQCILTTKAHRRHTRWQWCPKDVLHSAGMTWAMYIDNEDTLGTPQTHTMPVVSKRSPTLSWNDMGNVYWQRRHTRHTADTRDDSGVQEMSYAQLEWHGQCILTTKTHSAHHRHTRWQWCPRDVLRSAGMTWAMYIDNEDTLGTPQTHTMTVVPKRCPTLSWNDMGNVYWQRRHTRHTADTRDASGVQEMSYAQLEWQGQCILTTKAHSAHRRHTRWQWCPREVLRSAGMTWAMYSDNEGTLGTPQTHAMPVVSKRSPTLSWNDMGNVYWQRRHTADTRDDSGVQEMSYAQLEWHGQCIVTTKAHSAHRRHTRCQWCPREVLRLAGMTWAMYSDNEGTLGTPQTHAMPVVSKRSPTLSWNDMGNVYWQRRHTADTRDDSGVQEMSYAQLEWHGQCILTTKAHSAHRRHTRWQWCPRDVLRSAGMTRAMYIDNEGTLGTPQIHAMPVVSKGCPTLSWNDTGNVYWQRRHTRRTVDTRDASGVQEKSYAQLEWHGQCILTTKAHSAHRRHTRWQWCPRDVLRSAGMTWAMYIDNEGTPQTHAMTVVSKRCPTLSWNDMGNVYWQRRHTRHTADTRDASGVQEKSYAQLEWHGQCILTTKAHSAHRRHTRCQWCPRDVLRSAGMTWAMYIDNEGTLGTPQTHAMTVVSKRCPTLSWNDMGNVYWQRRHTRHTADTRDDSGVQEMSNAQLEWHGQCILTTKTHSAHHRHTRWQWCPRDVLRSAGMTWAMYIDNEGTLGAP